jgi:hypothetical protein
MSTSPTPAIGIVNDNTNSEYGTTSAQYQRTQSGIKRIRRMTITLGLLIMVMLVDKFLILLFGFFHKRKELNMILTIYFRTLC